MALEVAAPEDEEAKATRPRSCDKRLANNR